MNNIETKSPEYMLDKAMEICKNDPNSVIGVFFDSYLKLKELANTKSEISSQGMCYKPSGGGHLQLQYTSDLPIYHKIAGSQFSHIFIMSYGIGMTDLLFIRSRHRSHNEYKEPMGVYWPHGVERICDY